MTLEEIKSSLLAMSEEDQRRFISEVVPAIWTKACLDDGCVAKFRERVDEATIKEYRAQNMGGI